MNDVRDADRAERESWRSWARLMPPRRPRGDDRNIIRGIIAAEIGSLSDDERNVVADCVDAIEADREPAAPHDLLTRALVIAQLKRRHPAAWAK